MDNVILVAFITGLTAGGLSCFAVQGGLLTGSIARQVEAASQISQTKTANSKRSRLESQNSTPKGMLQPILLFMVAKLAAYTLLGFLLGLLGSMFTFSPAIQGVIQLAIGIFLVGNALRMFNVHPIFRYFSFEPPSQLTRYIRKVSKRGDQWITPVFLGALTILLPCGVTQSMMAVAVGTGNAALGAVIMFAFVLGSSPTFVGVSWLATSIGGLFQKYFYPIVAVIVLGLGLYSINSGLVLTGSPVSAASLVQTAKSAEQAPVISGNVAQINVLDNGYSPQILTLPANQEIELHLVTNNTRSCSRAFAIPDLNISELLPATGDVVVKLPPQPAGTKIQFMCSMGMYTGMFQFE